MRIALGVEYDGTDFFGWQIQQNLPTIQAALEKALSQVAAEPVQVFCAGRTDAGVHALGQVIHFETQVTRPLPAWTKGVNTYLPSSIAVQWAKVVPSIFHARFSAIARRYRYLIYNQEMRSPLQAARTTWYYHPLNLENMTAAAKYLIGEHDFTSFRSSQCESKTPMRCVQEIVISRNDNIISIEIQANAFLHHMVRNIVGVLLQIGSELKNPEWMQELLQAKDRKLGAITAPPEGLYLIKVIYPEDSFKLV